MLHKLTLFEESRCTSRESVRFGERMDPFLPHHRAPRLASAPATRGLSFLLADARNRRRPGSRTAPQHRPVPAPSPRIIPPEAGAIPWRGPKHSNLTAFSRGGLADTALQTTPPRATPPGEGGRGRGVSSPFSGAYWEGALREAGLHPELEPLRY